MTTGCGACFGAGTAATTGAKASVDQARKLIGEQVVEVAQPKNTGY